MSELTNVHPAASLGSLRTRVGDEEQGLDLSQTPTTHEAFKEMEFTKDGDALDGEINEAQQEKPFSHDPYMVVFQPGDPDNPKNWGRMKRWFLTIACSVFVLNSTFASSSPSGIIVPMMEHFRFSQEVGILTVSLFVAGYCFGPLLWGPLSEQYGRRPMFIIAFFGYTGFQVGNALAPNTAALLIFRLLGGIFASSPLTNSGAFIADIWDHKTRGKALALFCVAPFAGPALGPAVGGYIAISGASWRWLYWTLACFAGLCLLVMVLFIPETYEPVILARRAQRMRKETGDDRYFAAMERRDITFSKRIQNVLATPFVVLFHEPMLAAITIYMAFVYGCMYLLFEAFPIVFQKGHHMNAGSGGLMFIPLLVGGALGTAMYLVYFEPNYAQKIEQYKPFPVPPEERLRVAVWTGPLYVIAFFWFGWTSFPWISYWSPMMSGILFGFGLVVIFMSLTNYTIDAYLSVSASALAVTTVVRSLAGAVFPLFATQMFSKLNPRWASTLLGFIALLLMPIPSILIRYGPYLRRRSKYAPT